MSSVAVMASVAASRKCTLWAVFAVTMRLGPPGRLLGSIMQASFSTGCEQLVCTHHARGKALLVDVASQRREGRPVRLEPVRPEILAEHAPRLFHMIDQPRQRDAQRIGIIKAADCEI